MKKVSILSFCIMLLGFISCNPAPSGTLFDGENMNKWSTIGDVSLENRIMKMSGINSMAVLKKGWYKNFVLDMELRTTPGGQGIIGLHAGEDLRKGYQIAINNDLTDPVWWKMTGSLLSVRNLTKSFVKENEWFTMSIKVAGQQVVVTINGEPVVDYIQPAEPYRTANSGALLSEGRLSLISRGLGNVEFRNITINTLEVDDATIADQLSRANDEQTDEIIRLHQEDFPVLDYHVHLKGGLTKEAAAEQSRKTGINYVIAPNCGVGFPITNDDQIFSYLKTMRSQPFILAMQAEGREWLTTFSQEARNEFDFVFTDALTFTDNKGRRTRLWIKNETWIENEQQYMDMIVDRICMVLEEPVDVYVNPCFLPAQMADRYDEFWTEERMNKFIDALAKSGKALEINELYNIPSKAIIMKAKEAGVKFTFGTNNVVPEVSKLEYSIRMKKECGLTANDMYRPKVKL